MAANPLNNAPNRPIRGPIRNASGNRNPNDKIYNGFSYLETAKDLVDDAVSPSPPGNSTNLVVSRSTLARYLKEIKAVKAYINAIKETHDLSLVAQPRVQTPQFKEVMDLILRAFTEMFEYMGEDLANANVSERTYTLLDKVAEIESALDEKVQPVRFRGPTSMAGVLAMNGGRRRRARISRKAKKSRKSKTIKRR